MHTLVLIRHAIAEDRETWSGDDDAQRPLTSAGRRQAARIAKAVMEILGESARDEGKSVAALRSSPALRCVDTIGLLAARLHRRVEIDDGLMEGREIAPPSPRQSGAHILCAHGDNIPWLLDELGVDWDGRCKKGSIWLLRRDARGRTTHAEYRTIKKD